MMAMLNAQRADFAAFNQPIPPLGPGAQRFMRTSNRPENRLHFQEPHSMQADFDAGVRRLPCKARNVPDDHSPETAFFDIPHRAEHGLLLVCSHPACASSGRRFKYCAVCELPVAKRNFMRRHSHGLLQGGQNAIDDGDDLSEDSGSKRRRSDDIETGSSGSLQKRRNLSESSYATGPTPSTRVPDAFHPPAFLPPHRPLSELTTCQPIDVNQGNSQPYANILSNIPLGVTDVTLGGTQQSAAAAAAAAATSYLTGNQFSVSHASSNSLMHQMASTGGMLPSGGAGSNTGLRPNANNGTVTVALTHTELQWLGLLRSRPLDGQSHLKDWMRSVLDVSESVARKSSAPTSSRQGLPSSSLPPNFFGNDHVTGILPSEQQSRGQQHLKDFGDQFKPSAFLPERQESSVPRGQSSQRLVSVNTTDSSRRIRSADAVKKRSSAGDQAGLERRNNSCSNNNNNCIRNKEVEEVEEIGHHTAANIDDEGEDFPESFTGENMDALWDS